MRPPDMDQLSIRLGQELYHLSLTVYSMMESDKNIADETARIRKRLRKTINELMEEEC